MSEESVRHRMRQPDINKGIQDSQTLARLHQSGWGDAGGSRQQYLAKNPFGYRCHANTGVKFPA